MGTGKAGAKTAATEAEKATVEAAARAAARRYGKYRVMGGEDDMMGAMMGPLHWNMVSLLASLPGRWKYYNTMTVHGSRRT